MHSVIRVYTAVNGAVPGDPPACARAVGELVAQAAPLSPDILLFPSLALAGAGLGDLLQNRALTEAADEALDALALTTAGLSAYLVVGLPQRVGNRVVSCYAVLHGGELLGLLPGAPIEAAGEPFLPPETLFACGDIAFAIAPGDPRRLPLLGQAALKKGADLLLVPSALPAQAGGISACRDAARAFSAGCGCAVALCNAGVGQGSAPWLFEGFCGIYEAGEELAFAREPDSPVACCCDVDADILHALREEHCEASAARTLRMPNRKNTLLRDPAQNPFVPADPSRRVDYLNELFALQARSLAARMEKINTARPVLGVSGGIDSTLALLVAAAACDLLKLPRQNILAVSMPGFGTTDRTYTNSLSLASCIGAAAREIPIHEAVAAHFGDIGHDPAVRDVTYENAQARERTQILFDLANEVEGLVVGTGDLSEIALGFSTFGGDQFANFNVNACVTKTVARLLLEYLAQSGRFPGAELLIHDILGTPVSPELLPPGEDGKIGQKTEDILGPYELHEFFLYYFIRYAMPPSKVLRYAARAFEGKYAVAFIRATLETFLRRFYRGQFKRSAAPEGAVIAQPCLSAAVWTMPSDLSPAAMLAELARASG